MVGDPVPGENDGVAIDHAALPRVEVLDFDRLHDGFADDAGEPGAGGDLHAQQRCFAGEVEHGVGLRRGVLRGHQRGLAAGVFEGEHCGVADEFGADHDGEATDRAALEMNDVLKVSGGIDTGSPISWDHARRAGP